MLQTQGPSAESYFPFNKSGVTYVMSRKAMPDQIDTVVTADGILVVTMNHPPINGLSRAVNNGLTRAVLQVEASAGAIKGVVLHGAGRCFCAGADLTSFGGKETERRVKLGRPSTDTWGFEELDVRRREEEEDQSLCGVIGG
jgi:enoyl-CoA hydratase/carnithine racemase